MEGIWDVNEKAKQNKNWVFNKNDFVFKLMIRQPDFVSDDFVKRMIELFKKKKPHELLDSVKFEKITDGKCVKMLHLGSYDDEPASFEKMKTFAKQENLNSLSKAHREIYLSDFRKVAAEKLKTVLRFKVAEK